jgi:hypothetical protein
MPDVTETVSKDYIGIKVNPDTKTRWQNVAEENPEYRSLTHLIIVAVEAGLNEQPDSAGETDINMDGIHERLNSLYHEMREASDTVDEMYMHVRNKEMSGETELKGLVQDLIPTGEREDILRRTPEKPPRETPTDKLADVIGRTGSASHLARLLQNEGYRPIEIKGVIKQLADDVKGIEVTFARPQEREDKRVYRAEEYNV